MKLMLLVFTITAAPLLAQGKTDPTKLPPVHQQPPHLKDFKLTLMPGATLNSADTFTVARKPDKTCDWEKHPTLPKPKTGTQTMLAELRNADCFGVAWNVTPPKVRPPQKADTAGLRATLLGTCLGQSGLRCSTGMLLPAEMAYRPDTLTGRGREVRDMVNLVLARAPARAEVRGFITIDEEKFASVKAYLTPTSGFAYRLEKRDGRWVLLPGTHPFEDGK